MSLLKEETWKDIKWFEWLYMASNLWRIKSIERITQYKKWFTHKTPEHILSPSISKNWYCKIVLHKNNKKYYMLLHRLIILSFVYNINNYPQINHIDGNKTNNNLDNLEYCNASQNQIHSFNVLSRTKSRARLWKKWKDNPFSKMIYQYNLLWELLNSWHWWCEVQRELWFNQWLISHCCLWKCNTAYGFIWKYN